MSAELLVLPESRPEFRSTKCWLKLAGALSEIRRAANVFLFRIAAQVRVKNEAGALVWEEPIS